MLLLVLAAPLLGRAAIPNDSKPGQRIDSRVLLLSADGTEPGLAAWKAALEREGVPYDAIVFYTGQNKTAGLTDAQLADYGAKHAKYQAVILAGGDLGRAQTNRNQTTSYLSALTDAEWATLDKYERTFGIRRLSDFTAPSPIHGLNVVAGAGQDGRTGTLTDAGKKLFPYLKGPIPVANDDPVNPFEAFGYEATPTNAADWQTLVAGPTAGTSYLGIYTHPDDGREEMVMTVGSNQFQTHNQALRHGMLTWVTRGVFLGYQRNYLGLDVDDIFLPDDKWNPTLNVTDYTPAAAIRMTPADVDNAVAWQKKTGLKLNMVYNMGGVQEFGQPAGDNDALLARFRQFKDEFRWINHTLQHPNLDCTSTAFTRGQLVDNQTEFNRLLGPVGTGLNDPTEAITGEHSGLANVRPGNPGTIDPPTFNDLEPTTGGTLLPGTYEYAITARSPAGETVGSTATVTLAAGQNAVRADFNDVCHAIAFNLYRRQGTGAWALVGTSTRAARDPVDNGATLDVVSITDNGAAGTAGAPPTVNGAALAPYTQNPNYIPALTGAGIHTVASDSSKPYPNPSTSPSVSETALTNFPKGATFPVGPGIQAVPRYPSNVYYNVANRADQLDEYNWIYTSPPIGGCVPIANVTTCNAAEVNWDYYLASETRIMFGHVMGNDPRPHYFHQTNIAQSDPTKAATDTTVGGTLYAVIDTLLARYEQVFDRGSMPLLQLSQRQAAETLAQQDAWVAAQKTGQVSAWMFDGVLHVANDGTTPVDVPLTGTTEGNVYGGQRSGWVTIPPKTERTFGAPELAKSPPQPATAPSGSKPQGKKKSARLKLSKVRMSPKRFAVAHKRKRLGTRLDGSTITWRLNKPATVKLKFQRKRAGKWRKVGKIERRARAGGNVVRFRGRFGSRLLKPGRYRVIVTAKHNNERSGPKRVRFRVVKR